MGREVLRYTPAGVPVLQAQWRHSGALTEATLARTLDFEFDAIALGAAAQQVNAAALGGQYVLDGFIAPRSKRSTRLIIHINRIETVTGV
jgi:primosomal replication protein N